MLVLIGRLLWLIIGPIALFVLTLFIVITDSGWLTGYDLGFYITVGLMLLSRWLVIRSGYGRTIHGSHATLETFHHYAMRLVPWAVMAWTIANLVGNHLLPML